MYLRKKALLLRFLLIYPSYTLPSSAERRAGEDRENNGTTPRQQKVLFVNICHRHWLFSARGYPREKPPPFFVHYPENIRGILAFPPPVVYLPVIWQNSRLFSFATVGCYALAVPPARFPRL